MKQQERAAGSCWWFPKLKDRQNGNSVLQKLPADKPHTTQCKEGQEPCLSLARTDGHPLEHRASSTKVLHLA